MSAEFLVKMNDDALTRLQKARSRYGSPSMDDFVLLALALAERASLAIQPDGVINVLNGDPDDADTPVLAIRVKARTAAADAASEATTFG